MNKFLLFAALIILSTTFPSFSYAIDKLTIYSARNEQLISKIFEEYTKDTKTQIEFTTDKAGPLLQKLKAEGKNSPADILLTVDAGNLWQATQENLLEPIESKILDKNIPKYLRDPQKRWYGFSIRARTIIYSTERVKKDELTTYEDLASPKWYKRLCLRTSKKVYNQSLVAMIIEEHGIEKTEKIVKGWVKNLATPPFSNDTKMMKAIAAGQCDVGIANTYYFGRLIKSNPDIKLSIFWPNQKGSGVHVNISGAGILASSKNKKEALKFLEWLSSKKAQKIFADLNMEYPVNEQVKPSDIVLSWGKFKQNTINIAKAGELQIEAVKLMDRAGYK